MISSTILIYIVILIYIRYIVISIKRFQCYISPYARLRPLLFRNFDFFFRKLWKKVSGRRKDKLL